MKKIDKNQKKKISIILIVVGVILLLISIICCATFKSNLSNIDTAYYSYRNSYSGWTPPMSESAFAEGQNSRLGVSVFGIVVSILLILGGAALYVGKDIKDIKKLLQKISKDDEVDKIKELKNLLDDGAITKEEYEEKKKELLKKM